MSPIRVRFRGGIEYHAAMIELEDLHNVVETLSARIIAIRDSL
jgi:hypothetical protein